MREAGLVAGRGCTKVRTTVADAGHERATDKMNRSFTIDRPNRTRVADFSYLAAWCGIVYVCLRRRRVLPAPSGLERGVAGAAGG